MLILKQIFSVRIERTWHHRAFLLALCIVMHIPCAEKLQSLPMEFIFPNGRDGEMGLCRSPPPL